jgi:anti-anti-sigma regulatory factor
MVLKFEKEYTVENAADLKKDLSEALASEEDIDLDLSELEDADYSFFQLIHSAIKSTTNKVTILPGWQDSLTSKLSMTGLI